MSNISSENFKGGIFIKNKAIPIYLLKLEAAMRRIHDNHPGKEKVEAELRKQQAGLRGELTLDYYLSLLSKNDFLTITNLRLPNKNNFFQIDRLVMTTRFLLLLESKNIYGELTYHANTGQLTRCNYEQKEISYDPISQVERQKLQLIDLLQLSSFPVIPILTLVVITNAFTNIKIIPENARLPRNLVRAETLPMKINEIDRVHKKEYMTQAELRKMAKSLRKKHTSYDPDVLEKFGVSYHDLKKGVHCPACLEIGMERQRNGFWVCPSCAHKSKEAHKYTLNDHYLLVDKQISNRRFREFVGVTCQVDASRQLSKLNLKRSGVYKGTCYHLELFE